MPVGTVIGNKGVKVIRDDHQRVRHPQPQAGSALAHRGEGRSRREQGEERCCLRAAAVPSAYTEQSYQVYDFQQVTRLHDPPILGAIPLTICLSEQPVMVTHEATGNNLIQNEGWISIFPDDAS